MQMKFSALELHDVFTLTRENKAIVTKNKSTYVLSCRIEGESSFFYDNQEYKVKRGDILYIPKGAEYSQKSEYEKLIFFHFNAIGELSNKIQIFTPENKDKICNLFSSVYKIWSEKKENYYYQCTGELYKIISLFSLDHNNGFSDKCPILAPAMTYIHEHLYSPELSLEEACKKAHISRVYFNKLFFKEYQMTPIYYINSLRIKRAKKLLQTHNYTNDEISLLCGFNDVKYFYTVFKKHTGTTTKENL